MPLSPGDKLGPYEIVSQIGARGMGEVYRARDARLGRDVALKILPAELANDTPRRQRFELEAQAVAALSHPNIVAAYDVGPGYIVSELVDGPLWKSGASSAQNPDRTGRSARSRLPCKWIYFRAVSLQPHETSSSGSALGVVKMY